MCKWSIENLTVEAKPGQTLLIGKVAAHDSAGNSVSRGFFRTAPGSASRGVACDKATCVANDTLLTLIGVPESLQRTHGIETEVVVTMIDSGLYDEDMLRLPTGAVVPLIDFANVGVAAFVGVRQTAMQRVAGTVTKVIEGAIAGAAAVTDQDDEGNSGISKVLEDA